MSYRFDSPPPRRGTNSVKWDLGPEDLLPMWVADMDFPAPPAVVQAMQARVNHGVFGYCRAEASFVDAMIEWQRRRNGRTPESEHFLYAAGVMPAISAAIRVLTEPGDEIVVQPPVYSPFFSVVEDNGRRVVENPLIREGGPDGESRYRMDLEGLRAGLSPRTKMLLLCSPHNPVGRVWTRAELRDLESVLSGTDVVVVADEIHSDIVFEPAAFVGYDTVSPDAAGRTVTCLAASKTFNLAGLPASGLFVADKAKREALGAELARAGLTLPNVLAVTAVEAAYRHGGPWLDALLTYVRGNYEYLRERLSRDAPLLKVAAAEGTYLAWIDFSALGVPSGEVKRRLRKKARLWLSEGADYGSGGQGFFRMNLATSRERVEEALDRLVASLHEDGRPA